MLPGGVPGLILVMLTAVHSVYITIFTITVEQNTSNNIIRAMLAFQIIGDVSILPLFMPLEGNNAAIRIVLRSLLLLTTLQYFLVRIYNHYKAFQVLELYKNRNKPVANEKSLFWRALVCELGGFLSLFLSLNLEGNHEILTMMSSVSLVAGTFWNNQIMNSICDEEFVPISLIRMNAMAGWRWIGSAALILAFMFTLGFSSLRYVMGDSTSDWYAKIISSTSNWLRYYGFVCIFCAWKLIITSSLGYTLGDRNKVDRKKVEEEYLDILQEVARTLDEQEKLTTMKLKEDKAEADRSLKMRISRDIGSEQVLTSSSV